LFANVSHIHPIFPIADYPSTQVGSGLARKYETRVSVPSNGKHSSVLSSEFITIPGCKMF
jgi:hypothetical protein